MIRTTWNDCLQLLVSYSREIKSEIEGWSMGRDSRLALSKWMAVNMEELSEIRGRGMWRFQFPKSKQPYQCRERADWWYTEVRWKWSAAHLGVQQVHPTHTTHAHTMILRHITQALKIVSVHGRDASYNTFLFHCNSSLLFTRFLLTIITLVAFHIPIW